MNIITTSKLTSSQLNDLSNLVHLCEEYDNIHGYIYDETEQIILPSFPCFYMAYDKNVLVGVLTAFLPTENEAEIYSYTLPSMRRQHIFTELLTSLNKECALFSVKKISFVIDPNSTTGKSVLNSIGTKYSHSEYLLKYTAASQNILSDDVSLDASPNEYGEHISFLKNNSEIGCCNIALDNSSGTIYDFEIFEEYQGNGNGKYALANTVNHLLSQDVHSILLHVTGKNTRAKSLYLNHGFSIREQLEYWTYK